MLLFRIWSLILARIMPDDMKGCHPVVLLYEITHLGAAVRLRAVLGPSSRIMDPSFERSSDRCETETSRLSHLRHPVMQLHGISPLKAAECRKNRCALKNEDPLNAEKNSSKFHVASCKTTNEIAG